MTEPDALPPELKDLLAAERAAPTPDAAARAVAHARLLQAVGHAAPGAAGSAFGAAKGLVILAVVVAVGTFLVVHGRSESHDPATSTRTTPAQTAAPPMPVAVSTPGPTVAPSLAPAASPAPAPSPAPAVRHAPSSPHVERAPVRPPIDATSEAELIRRAWSALAVGDPDRALAIVRDDEHLHRDGALAEEREAVRIVALARLGRLDEAQLAATQFEHDYPSSLHHDLVIRAVGGSPDRDR
jgi:hypothetical protein